MSKEVLALENFANLTIEICELLQNNEGTLSIGYPFDISFDEIMHGALIWLDALKTSEKAETKK